MIKCFEFSVVVISYNSAKTVLSTLESIKAQTIEKKSIQLIVSDDASDDDTVCIVEKWISKNKNEFGETILISSDLNKGVSVNFNRGLKAAKGKWVKPIAADDILDLNCLRNNIKFIDTTDAEICFSPVKVFHERIGDSEAVIFNKDFFSVNAANQNKLLRKKNYIYAASLFIKKELLEKVGYADERFPMLEDYPLWYKITKMGIKIHAHEVPTAYYRVAESLSINNNKIANLNFINSGFYFRKYVLWQDLRRWDILRKHSDFVNFISLKSAVILFNNKRSFFSKLYIASFNLINPLGMHFLLKNKIIKIRNYLCK